MKKTLLIAAATLFGAATPAMAATITFEEVDADSNGEVSLTEIQAVAPDVTEDRFDTFDHDDDGALSETEFRVWTMSLPGEPEAEAEVETEAETMMDEPQA
jgi:Ca2+-binding EF-hand superfamily protein